MANQKEIRTKIDSVKKTKKITTAMKLVAAAKVNKVLKKVTAIRPFSENVKEILGRLQSASENLDLAEYPLLKKSETVKKVLLVVYSSDRGLCGAFNTNIFKAARNRIEELKAEGKEVSLFTIGRKANTALSKAGYDIEKNFANLPSMPTSTEAQLIAEYATEQFATGAVDKVEVIYTKFISMVNNEVETKQFLPIELDEVTGHSDEQDKEAASKLQAQPEIIFDPDAKSLINTLLPMYTENLVFRYALESVSSELAARMTAMSNATTNAEAVINKLVLSYNKARQASITQELSEIVAGAAAL